MGGDLGPRLTVSAALATLQRHPNVRIRLYGDESEVDPVLHPLLSQFSPSLRARVERIHCTQTVAMEEKPALALRRKRDSSLWRSIQAVADGEAGACISAGNTGALMAMGIAQLGLLPGIERPAICTAVPTLKGRAWLLDMGANLDCDAGQLVQFARMASAMVQVVEGMDRPRVGLLNVGSEQGKGGAVVQEAAQLLSADKRINYQGFVEGDGIYGGAVDIVVCDGFVGNVALKAGEGVARLIATMLRDSLQSSLVSRFGAWLARPALKGLAARIDPASYNGASLLGLEGVVVKSHGGATSEGFAQSLEVAITAIQQQLPKRIAAVLAGYEPMPSNATI